MHYLLFYEKAPGYAERQKPFAAAHRDYLQEAVRRGELVLAGSLYDPDDGAALLLFRADSPVPVEAVAQGDPYVVHGIISRWWVRKWDIVLGTDVPRSP